MLAVSMGDPAGIGPEIAVKAWAARGPDLPPFAVFGNLDAFSQAASRLGLGDPVMAVADAGEAARAFARALPVVPGTPLGAPVTPGTPDPAHAPAILASIRAAVAACREGVAAGVVTLPIAKAPLYAAGFRLPGHTEYLADLTADMDLDGPRGPVMMLAGGDLRVALATIHLPLREVAARLDIEGLVHLGRVVDAALRRDFALAAPRLAMAGLNPHAGEGGGLGQEEETILRPAAQRLRALGIDCSDPRPADTLFHPEARAGHDVVLAMYHDQGLVPLKMLAFWEGVNVTLGLPIVRTSPDHGTGFDIAGRGVARPDSFVAALKLAARIAASRAGAAP